MEHKETWTNGTPLIDVSSDGFETLPWNKSFFEMAWPKNLRAGTYDLILDLNVSGYLGVWTNVTNPYSGEPYIDDPIWVINVTGPPGPGIKVTKVASPSAGAPSTNVNFSIVVTNTGDCTLDPVKLVDTLPTGMSFVSSSPVADSQVGSTLTWDNVGHILASNSTIIYLTAHIDAGASGMLNNTANATGTPPAGDNVTDEVYEEVTALVPGIQVTKVASPSAGAPSTNVNFSIVVTNTGDCTLDPVKLVDTLPTGMSFVSSSPVADSQVGSTLTWDNVGPILASNSKTIFLVAHVDADAIGMLNNTANATGTPPAGDNVSDSDTADVEVLAPRISVIKIALPTEGTPCTNVTFSINVTNTGNCTLNPVKVVDTLPAGMSYVVAGTSPTPDSVVGNTITWDNVSALNTGQSTMVTLVAHIDTGASGTLTDNVTATGTPPAGDNVSDSDTADVEVLAPRISVTKIALPTEGTPCTNVTFSINVTNTGNCTLNPVKVVDTLPAGMSYVVAGTSPTPDSVVGNTITWNNVSSLDPGQSTMVTLVAHIDTGASGTLTDIVNVTGTPPTGENVTSSDTVDVEALTSSIKVTKTASPSSGGGGTGVTFTIGVTNTGDSTLDPVKVVDTLPAGMNYVEAGTSPEPSSVMENIITWNNIGLLNPLASSIITLAAHIESSASGTLTDIVNVSGTPPTGDNVTDSATADVQALGPDIRVNNTVSPAAAMPDTDVTFTINVTNTGDCTLNPVRMVDTLPAEMSYVASKPEVDYHEGQMIIWNNVSLLDPWESAIITLVAHIDSGASGTLNNTANASGTPPTGENVTGSDTADVVVEEQPPTPTAQVPEFTSIEAVPQLPNNHR